MRTTPNRLLNKAFFHDDVHVQLNGHRLTEPFELHWHEFYELTYVLSGQGTNTVNGVPHVLKPGHLFLLTPADFHDIAPLAGTTLELYNLIFSQAMLSDEMVKLLFFQDCGRYAHFDDEKSFASVLFRFDSILSEQNDFASARHIAVQCELNRLLVEWHRHRNKSISQDEVSESEKTVQLSPMPPSHPGIQKSLIYIQHHFRHPLTLEEAAQQAHLSPNYFSEQFRKSTGISFQLYLQQLRLQFAHALLRTSALPVTEVSLISGFNTLTHFERVFRSRYGMTPREAQKMKNSSR